MLKKQPFWSVQRTKNPISPSVSGNETRIMQNLPIGIHTFERIRNENLLYIDKTKDIYQLITTGSVYFLSRPRRFGKSLLISTLKAIFEGKRHLFEDLWINQNTDYAFESYHVVHIDMSQVDSDNAEQLKNYLLVQVKQLAKQHSLNLEHGTYSSCFGELIQKLGQDKPVVILIDEYDKPILDHLTKPARDTVKDALKGFYNMIKANDPYLRFVLLTGVTKFSKISVFSGLNNLIDISMNKFYAEMLGVTQEELETYFADRIEQLAKSFNIRPETLLEQIKYWYNGYRFSEKPVYVYNPFSTLSFFFEESFKFYWFETGTPTFLLELIKNNPQSWPQIPEEKWASERAFSTYEIEHLEALPLLFQSGYLTIQDIDDSFAERLYLLDYSNFEVKQAFLSELLGHFSEISQENTYIFRIIQFFEQGEIDEVLEELKIFFANIPYDLHIKNEKYYQTIFFAIFQLLGFNIDAEIKTNRGRIDCVVDMPDTIYLFEFKLFGTKEEALKQIKTQKYFQKFMRKGKPIHKIGVEFDKTERNIGDWVVESTGSQKRNA